MEAAQKDAGGTEMSAKAADQELRKIKAPQARVMTAQHAAPAFGAECWVGR